MKNFKNLTYLTLAGVTAIGVSSCGKYEDGPGFSLLSKKSRVVGDWEVKSIGADVYGTDYSVNMSFEKSGDLLVTSSYSYQGSSQSYSYAGSWDFASDKEQLSLIVDGSVQLFEIKRLTNKEMWLDDDITALDGAIWKLESK
ncbi:MAG: hypothetical protein K9G40_12990 [Crocinitomicaceae bacterium]|nr:hypothetical protein [Crocinitomicaceae bacterium]MCF8433966.1 hypothetical protein [Crocinitomicaceae bacterium]